MNVIKYDDSLESDLEIFCNECKKLNYKNNESIDKLKLDKVEYICIYDGNKIIAISGSHKVNYYGGTNDWGVWYRTAVLPSHSNYFNKIKPFGASSIAFRICLKETIILAKQNGGDNFLFTTNLNNNSGPHMVKQNNHSRKFESLGIFEWLGEYEVYSVNQNLWKINYDKYFEYLKVIHES